MNNNENKMTPFEFIKGIPNYQKDNVQPLAVKVRDLKDLVKKAKDELTKKREELNIVKHEELAAQAHENVAKSDAAKAEGAVKAAAAAPIKEKVEDKAVQETKAEDNVSKAEVAPVEKQPKTEDATQPKVATQPTADTKTETGTEPAKLKTYINTGVNNSTGGGQPNRDNQGGYNNNRPNNGYQNRDNQGGYNNNRPAQTGGYNNNRPAQTGGYNNNRPAQTGGYNNNRPAQPGGYNNNRPNTPGGYNNNNNRPAGGGNFAPRVPRLPRPDMAPPPATPNRGVDTRKKKSFVEEPKKQQINKRTLVRKGYVDENDFDENGVVRHIKQRRGRKLNNFTPNTVNIEHAIVNTLDVPIKVLADRIGKTATEIVKKCFMLGQMHNINSVIDFDTAELIASEFNITLEYVPAVTAEDTLNAIVQAGSMTKRPPVVTIMGHVDHGKTSLLDYIRQARVAQGEAGGITQHIGAYTINVNDEQITFLDTPGHEAFTSMRMRGAKITDIAVVVVAADDGIMPQTIEAFNHAKEAGVSIMVAVNKIDKPAANVDKIMQQLAQHDILPEEWGGDVIVTPLSAKTGQGVDKLLENIVLLAEVKELKAIVDCPARGNVIEAKLDKGIGPVASVLVQNGTLRVGDYVVAGTCTGKVRALIDDTGRRIKEAGPSIAVSVLGLSEVPNAGDTMVVVEDEKLAKEVATERMDKERLDMQSKSARKNLEDMFKGMSDDEMKSLGIIIKGDVQGSVEAVKQAFVKLSDEMAPSGVKITIIHAGVGAINESDIRLADTANSIIVAFNVRPEPKAKALAERSHVDIKTYRIIYDAIDDVTKALKGMLDPVFREEIIGHAEVRETFRITNVGTIAGCYITDGKVARNAKFRLIRDNVVVYDGNISSMKRNKDEAKEVATGYECGIGLENFNDIKVGDIIEAFLLKQEEQ